MRTLGHLIAFTRQLDVTMISDVDIESSRETFNRLTAGAISENN
jgi:hypothetical protein